MTDRRVTLADVARRAGLSPTAASLILNDRPGARLSEAAAARVRAAAAELGYRPNAAARTLSTSRSRTIGLISDGIATTRYVSLLIRGALAEARAQGYVLLIAETGGEENATVKAAETLTDHQVDGIVYATVTSHEVVLPPAAGRARVVLLNATSATDHPRVLPDEHAAGRAMASVLLDAGHREGIAVIGQRRSDLADGVLTVAVTRRLEGLWSALDESGVQTVAEVTCEDWGTEEGERAVSGLLEAGTPLKALICLNDRLSFGAYWALTDHGLRIPDDVSIVSFDDDEIAAFLRPGLTTAALPLEQMGRRAVQILLGDGQGAREVLVAMPVRRRNSVGPPRG